MFRLLMVGVAAWALAGCEGCDFSFGGVPVEVRITPEDVVATVQICDLEGDEWVCTTEQINGPDTDPDTGATSATTPAPEGTLQTSVSWDGYVTCRYPALEIDVVAEGCEPAHVSVPKSRSTDAPIVVDVALDCG